MPLVAVSSVTDGIGVVPASSAILPRVAGVSQKQPTQIGISGSPCSNSTHTLAPTGGGTNEVPIIGPAIGTQGRAQLLVRSPNTSGTRRMSGPGLSGWRLVTPDPRYLPKRRLRRWGSGPEAPGPPNGRTNSW